MEIPSPAQVKERRDRRIERETDAELWRIACRIVAYSESGKRITRRRDAEGRFMRGSR